ncbi:MAG TPA: HAD family hydrolase [Gaiellales bacterium]|nr:HAD family hydrolase [Gaiellales bacterium]
MLVTFDLFSALLDARTGGSAAFGQIVAAHGWDVAAEELYDRWDAANKASQRDETEWLPFTEHSRRALAAVYADLGLDGDADADTAVLLGSVGNWPLWPDVEAGLPQLAQRWTVGVLSNVDDVVFARTRVAPLVADDAVLTSERLRAYKPGREIYRRARERAGDALVHVATSARDVRGALEAGLDVVRLRRPGHELDPDGPRPERTVASVEALGKVLGLP